jgi:frizzled 5/8
MKKFGFDWPEHMNCDLFPEYGSPNQVCMDPMDAQFQTTHKNKKLNINHNLAVATSTPLNNNIMPHRQTETVLDQSVKNEEISDVETTPSLLDVLCVSPLVKTQSSRLHSSFGGLENCGQHRGSSCDMVEFFDDHSEKKAFTHYWLLTWSIICFFSSLCTALTFMLQPSRFKYPEKPIIFLSICYLFVSFGYLMRLLRSREVCGEKSFDCTLSFMLIYYFGMVSAVWWVILAFTWFLAAGLKWGSEAIAKYHVYFHLLAWLLPFAQTCVILAYSSAGVDTDSLSGICLVGNLSTQNLLVFIIAPSLVYLSVGVTFLAAGFVALFRIRKTIQCNKQKQDLKAHKLEKLMMRIGVFSILYTVPATCVLACQFYERMYRVEWERSFMCKNVKSAPFSYEYRQFCAVENSKPEFTIFLLKYLMSLIVGVTSGFWIWTNKTCMLWKSFFSIAFNRLNKTFCSTRPSSSSASTSSSSATSSSNVTHTTALSDLNSLASNNNNEPNCFGWLFCLNSTKKHANALPKSMSKIQSHNNEMKTKMSRDSIIYFQANDDIENNPHNFKETIANNNNNENNNNNVHILVDDNVIYQKHHSTSTSTPMHQNYQYQQQQQQNLQYKHYLQHNSKLYACNPNQIVETCANYDSSTQSVTSQPIYQTHGNFNNNRQAVIYYDYTNGAGGVMTANDMNTMSSKYSVPGSVASSKK